MSQESSLTPSNSKSLSFSDATPVLRPPSAGLGSLTRGGLRPFPSFTQEGTSGALPGRDGCGAKSGTSGRAQRWGSWDSSSRSKVRTVGCTTGRGQVDEAVQGPVLELHPLPPFEQERQLQPPRRVLVPPVLEAQLCREERVVRVRVEHLDVPAARRRQAAPVVLQRRRPLPLQPVPVRRRVGRVREPPAVVDGRPEVVPVPLVRRLAVALGREVPERRLVALAATLELSPLEEGLRPPRADTSSLPPSSPASPSTPDGVLGVFVRVSSWCVFGPHTRGPKSRTEPVDSAHPTLGETGRQRSRHSTFLAVETKSPVTPPNLPTCTRVALSGGERHFPVCRRTSQDPRSTRDNVAEPRPRRHRRVSVDHGYSV